MRHRTVLAGSLVAALLLVSPAGAAAHRDQNTYKRTRELVGRTAPADMPLEMKSVLGRLLQDQLAKDKT